MIGLLAWESKQALKQGQKVLLAMDLIDGIKGQENETFFYLNLILFDIKEFKGKVKSI